jgi:hypothetical protein
MLFTLGSREQGAGRGLEHAAKSCLTNSLHRSACKIPATATARGFLFHVHFVVLQVVVDFV